MYCTNNEGFKREKYVRLEGLKMLIIGPLFMCAGLFLSYISMSKWLAYFYLTSPIFLLMMIFLFIYAPMKMISKQRRTLSKLVINENTITITTCKMLWLRKIDLILTKREITIKKRTFSGYGTTAKQGLLIKLSNGKEFYLIKDYFDDYNLICEKLEVN